jgi:hypothetical protein
MRKLLLPAVLFLAFAVPVRAQTQTTVTATVIDPGTIPYAGATALFTLVGATGGSPCVMTGGNCVPISTQAGPATLNAAGFFSLNVYPNASILCGGKTCTTQWNVRVNISPGVLPPWGTGPQTFNANVTISGSSQDISTTLNALAPALTNPLGGTSITVPWGNIKPGTLTGTGNYNTTGGANFDFSGAQFELPFSAGFSTNNEGQVGFDTTAGNWHFNLNTADAIVAPFTTAPANGDCIEAATSGGGQVTLADFGQPCATSSQAQLPAVLSNNFTTLSSNISVTENTVTTVLAQAITMPSTGCPCSALVSYGTYAETNNQTWNTWVNDGAYSMASAQATGAGTNNIGLNASQMSPVTYNGGDTITFTEDVEVNGTGATVTAAPEQGNGTNSWLSVSIQSAAVAGFDKAITQSVAAATSFAIGPISPSTLQEIPIALVVGSHSDTTPVISAGAGATQFAVGAAVGTNILTTTIANPTTVNATASESANMAAVLALFKTSGTVSVVQNENSNIIGTSNTTTFGTNTTAHHAILALVEATSAASSQTAVQFTDSQGNFYQAIGTIYLPSSAGNDAVQATMFIATNIKGGTDAVTCTISQSQTDAFAQVLEISGIQ